MSGFHEFMAEHLRLSLLRLLKEAGGSANESVLRQGATALGHHWAGRAEMRTQLEWLKERGLVTHEWFDDKVLVAHLTDRGIDVAEGRTVVEGVTRPSRIG
jgi:hypothetical protein